MRTQEEIAEKIHEIITNKIIGWNFGALAESFEYENRYEYCCMIDHKKLAWLEKKGKDKYKPIIDEIIIDKIKLYHDSVYHYVWVKKGRYDIRDLNFIIGCYRSWVWLLNVDELNPHQDDISMLFDISKYFDLKIPMPKEISQGIENIKRHERLERIRTRKRKRRK